MERQFPLGDILSIATGRLLTMRQWEGVHEILSFMQGKNLEKRQLYRAFRECQPHILRQFPQFAEVAIPEFRQNQFPAVLNDLCEQYGAEHLVKPLPGAAVLAVDVSDLLADSLA